ASSLDHLCYIARTLLLLRRPIVRCIATVPHPDGYRARMDAAARVRGATVEDAAAIARVHIESHRQAYVASGLIPRAALRAWPEAARAEYWRAFAGLDPRPDGTVVVAEVGGEIVGFAAAGPSLDDDLVGGWQLYAIYLLESAQGTGLGQALIDAALDGRAAS